MRRLPAFPLFAGAFCAALHAAGPAPTPPRSAVVLELYTSEGCSSCPPADALLRDVDLKTTAAGQLVVGISEHVTYWNRLGWKDPYSGETFTERQNAYAARFRLDSPYTPQMVLNGREQFVGSDRAQLAAALQAEANRPGLKLQIAASLSDVPAVEVEVDGPVPRPLDVMAVISDDADRSNVLRGENAGSLLQHVAVARTLERIGSVAAPGRQRLQLGVPEELRASLHGGHHLIVFLQEPQQGAILGAAAEPL